MWRMQGPSSLRHKSQASTTTALSNIAGNMNAQEEGILNDEEKEEYLEEDVNEELLVNDLTSVFNQQISLFPNNSSYKPISKADKNF